MKIKTIIVSAPSGAGKSSFVNRICAEDPRLVDVITYTTRPMRRGENTGESYHFTSREDFLIKIKNQFFVEWAEVHRYLYGTPWDQIHQAWSRNCAVIMDLDIQGAQSFREKLPEGLKTIFIVPPSISELRRRIIARDGNEPLNLELRLENARIELEQASQFDVQIVNDDFESSYQEFKKYIDLWLSED